MGSVNSIAQVDAVGYGLVELKLIVAGIGKPHGGIASAPEKKFRITDSVTSPSPKQSLI